MPTHGPPERPRLAYADAKDESEEKDHADIHCVLSRLLQMVARKDRRRDQGRGPETGPAPERPQRIPTKGVFLGNTDQDVCDKPEEPELRDIFPMQGQSV